MTVDRLGMTVLSQDECFELLGEAQVGRLAVSIGPHPDIFPINYVVDGASIVFRTAEGTKLAAAVLTPHIAFEADGVIDGSDEAWSVVVKGHAREIEGLSRTARRARPAAVPVAGRAQAPLRADHPGRGERPPLRRRRPVGVDRRRAGQLTPAARRSATSWRTRGISSRP